MIQIQFTAHHRAIRITNKYVGPGEPQPDETFLIPAGECSHVETDDNPDWHMALAEVMDA